MRDVGAPSPTMVEEGGVASAECRVQSAEGGGSPDGIKGKNFALQNLYIN